MVFGIAGDEEIAQLMDNVTCTFPCGYTTYYYSNFSSRQSVVFDVSRYEELALIISLVPSSVVYNILSPSFIVIQHSITIFHSHSDRAWYLLSPGTNN